MIKKTLVVALLGSLLLCMTSCGTLRRVGKNALITVSSPYVIIHGASTDGVADAQNIQKGFGASDWVQHVVLPLTFAFRFVDHTISTCVYAGDILFTPLYALAEIHPDTVIKPLSIYQGTPFGPWPDNQGEPAWASVAKRTIEAYSK